MYSCIILSGKKNVFVVVFCFVFLLQRQASYRPGFFSSYSWERNTDVFVWVEVEIWRESILKKLFYYRFTKMKCSGNVKISVLVFY